MLNLGDDLADRARRDIRRAAAPLLVTTSPLWIVQPYADPAACWGCGLTPEGPERTPGGCRLCGWCSELLAVDKANQRREQGRHWPGLIL
jgi:hypothetical protein